MNTDKKKVILLIFLVILVNITGIAGYHFIEGWNLRESFYMTIITLSTTGYREVYPLSPDGQMFTAFLIIFGMGVVAFSISVVMSYLVNLDWSQRRRQKMLSQIQTLHGHTIVCGFGRLGRVICEELVKAKVDFVVIDCEELALDHIKAKNYLYVAGNATEDSVLEKAGVNTASTLLSMLDSDADALYLTLAARSLNNDLNIVVRSNDEKAKKRILRAGASKVVLPIVMSGKQIAESVLHPAIEGFFEMGSVSFDAERTIQFADLPIKAGSGLDGECLKSKGSEMRDLIIVAVRNKENDFSFFPRADYIFRAGDNLVAMGTHEAYQHALEHFKLM